MADDSRIRLDLNAPAFLDEFLALEAAELRQVVGSLRRLKALDWESLIRHPGYQWEAIRHVVAPGGATVHSLRMSQRIRALAYRDGEFLRFLSLHPDHDSAYRRR